MKTIVLVISLLVLSTAAHSQIQPPPASAPGVEEAYLAKDDGNGKAGEQVDEFKTTDVPIYCVILLESTVKSVVKMNFVAVNVLGVKPDTKVVTASYTTKEGQNRVNFTGRPETIWTPGRYRVDLFIDGKLAKNLVFDIKGPSGNSTAAKYFEAPQTPKSKPRH